ncbi:MAG: radical SAM family heme chaperone HemW [Phycisphaerales bacterium]|nr:MAG: radical SAM family heme chaperone HemW [Phycisphaerales bacterium]
MPFCSRRCHYCDFYSVVDTPRRRAMFGDRLIEETKAAHAYFQGPVETLFVGGGTPSVLEPRVWDRLFRAVAVNLPLAESAEFTVEANPESLTAELAAVLASGGVNRISLGAQSFNRRQLATLQREHEPAAVPRSIEHCRAAGIHNISLDLIFAIPGQSREDWLADLDRAVELSPDHLSCYGLTYEPGTPLTQAVEEGRIRPADEELEVSMYEAAIDRLAEAGFEHYEISNWARPGRRCRHNLGYWHNCDYWPLGPAAAGHVAGLRWKNRPDLDEYLAQGPLPPIVEVERPNDDREAGEELMLGLRLIEGLPQSQVETILVRGRRGKDRAAAIDRHIDGDLLVRADGRLRLTRRGLLLADTVLADLV